MHCVEGALLTFDSSILGECQHISNLNSVFSFHSFRLPAGQYYFGIVRSCVVQRKVTLAFLNLVRVKSKEIGLVGLAHHRLARHPNSVRHQ